MKDKRISNLIFRICISALLVMTGVLLFLFETQIEEIVSGNIVAGVEKSDFKMYTIDVGQGDAIFIEFSDNRTMLVDCGKVSAKNKLEEFFVDKDIETIDYLVYTHSDEDHIGGGEYIFNNFQVNVLYRPKRLSYEEVEKYGNPYNYTVHSTKAYNNAIMPAYSEPDCEIKYSFKGEEILGKDYKVKFLSPSEDTYIESNSYSAVLMVEVNSRKILLTGDAESDIEEKLILEYNNYLDADILKVSHHASKTASSKNFLNLVTPEYALISVGDNQWNMPHEEVLERLKNADVGNIYDTKKSGTIVTGINDSGEINVYGFSQIFNLDMPIIIGVLIFLLLLTWGVRLKTKNKVKKKY